MKTLLSFTIIAILLGSCSVNHIEKRRYKNGWYISSNNGRANQSKANKATPETDSLIVLETKHTALSGPEPAVEQPLQPATAQPAAATHEPATNRAQTPVAPGKSDVKPAAKETSEANTEKPTKQKVNHNEPTEEESRLRRDMVLGKGYFLAGTAFSLAALIIMGSLIFSAIFVPALTLLFPFLVLGMVFSLLGILKNRSVVKRLATTENAQLKSKAGLHKFMLGAGWLFFIAGFISLVVTGTIYLVVLMVIA
ncbi:MAG: hypothetical protein MUC87_13965 [Bacteroidia bacterium]|jgi:hypothetical protein|nr:hypothetical protein [Bacteroidia bacterium]